jgi:choline dehydrogenase-like flavoprotein
VPICPVQAKYNALKTFKKAKEKNRDLLEIKSQAVAYQILIDRKTNLVQGIKFKRYEKDQNATYTTQVASGKIYVLAASAIENAKLLLVSDAAGRGRRPIFPRFAMDHFARSTPPGSAHSTIGAGAGRRLRRGRM